jgi:hypothetical protein
VRLLQISYIHKSISVYEDKELIAAFSFEEYPTNEQVEELLSMTFTANNPTDSFDWTI